MQINLNALDLKAIWAKLKPAIDSKPTHKIMQYVLFEPDGDRLKITASDLTIWIKTSVVASFEGSEIFALKFNDIEGILKSIVKGKNSEVPMTLTKKNKDLWTVKVNEIVHKVSAYYDEYEQDGKLVVETAEKDYPVPPTCDKVYNLHLDGKVFCDLVSTVGYAVGKPINRGTTEAINFISDGEHLTVQAVNGHLLSESRTEMREITPFRALTNGNVLMSIIKAKSLDFTNQIKFGCFEDPDGMTVLEDQKTKILIWNIKGKYLDFTRAIPNHSDAVKVTFKTKQILAFLETANKAVKTQNAYKYTVCIPPSLDPIEAQIYLVQNGETEKIMTSKINYQSKTETLPLSFRLDNFLATIKSVAEKEFTIEHPPVKLATLNEKEEINPFAFACKIQENRGNISNVKILMGVYREGFTKLTEG